jgi:glyoxylase-like metal-dependent hydrolase (beta-lactamase superfamily II)
VTGKPREGQANEMTMQARTFGPYQVQHLVDGNIEMDGTVLIHLRGDEARTAMLTRLNRPKIAFPIHCFLLTGPDGPTLIDSGTGTLWGDTYGHARTALADAGISPADIQHILLTHVHADHAAGLLDGDTPYFPNAEILVPSADLAHFGDAAIREATPVARRSAFGITERMLSAYDGRIREINAGQVTLGITAEALPGHTPGHMGYRLSDPSGDLLLWGDTVHVHDLQPADPDIGLVFDVDPQLAGQSRRNALERAADHGWLVAGAHVPGFARIARDGETFRYIPT